MVVHFGEPETCFWWGTDFARGRWINQRSAKDIVHTEHCVPRAIIRSPPAQHETSMTGIGGNILLPANDVNTVQVQASDWTQFGSSWYPAPLTHLWYGWGQPANSHGHNTALVVDGAGCRLVEMNNHKLIARGWPDAQLLEFQWEDSLLTNWCISWFLSKAVSQTSTHYCGCGQMSNCRREFVSARLRKKIPLDTLTLSSVWDVLCITGIILWWSVTLSKIYIVSQSLSCPHLPENMALICCIQLWFIHEHHISVEMHNSNNRRQ